MAETPINCFTCSINCFTRSINWLYSLMRKKVSTARAYEQHQNIVYDIVMYSTSSHLISTEIKKISKTGGLVYVEQDSP